ncbi:hypothetical protein [Symbioplanes lichenis]|uniref:hypothetical protein n=1 Tax=Symbioplanes lichenis TaxID=1629072 RepID=UPI00273A4DE3|nr:hypothetical protein [Actinoplanes lichenis]
MTDHIGTTGPAPRILGQGSASVAGLGRIRGGRASFYADPVSWLIAAAAREAVENSPARVLSRPEDVAVICVSAQCTTWTMAAVARGLAAESVSPLRFAGANPAAVAGLVCVELGFRGPSLALPMPPGEGLPPATALARSWLHRGKASAVVLVTHEPDAAGGHTATATVLGPGERP